MSIDGATRLCGLIGYPVGHTLSPVIHNYLAKEYGQNLVYVPLPVEARKLEQAIIGADAFDFLGMNVTVPYKSAVIPYLREIDDIAKTIGAVNTLVRVDGGYKGYNTDILGLYKAMVSDNIEIEGQEVLILGAGGVARAVSFLMNDKKAAHLTIMNRTLDKAKCLTDELNERAGYEFAEAICTEDYKKLTARDYLTIQATNIGMSPKVGKAVIMDEDFYVKVKVGYDLIFNPAETEFMRLVRKQGKTAYNGLKMLLYQGLSAYELWNGIAIREETAKELYAILVEQMQKRD